MTEPLLLPQVALPQVAMTVRWGERSQPQAPLGTASPPQTCTPGKAAGQGALTKRETEPLLLPQVALPQVAIKVRWGERSQPQAPLWTASPPQTCTPGKAAGQGALTQGSHGRPPRPEDLANRELCGLWCR